jgi:hypothetical protein
MDEEKYLKKVMELTNRSPYYRLLKMEILEIRKGKSVIIPMGLSTEEPLPLLPILQ